MKIAIDIMNGDKSPSSSINGAIQYLKNNKATLYLVGKKSILQNYKKKLM